MLGTVAVTPTFIIVSFTGTDMEIIGPRPETMKGVFTFLARHSLRHTGDWELAGNGIAAPVWKLENTFNGVVAADLWNAVGTTHEEWTVSLAREVEDGDLISDMGISEPYVVAGHSRELDTMKIHMVGEGREWTERHTAEFPVGQLVQLARKK